MELINKTSFPSLSFRARDQHGQPSHVLVMRATYDIKSDGTLQLAGKQAPIVLTDEYHGEPNKSSVRQESDLVPYKPRCDVIVNATAYAPGRSPSLGFLVGVKINGPSGEDGKPGPVLLVKKLIITGPRCWEKGMMGGWKLQPPNAPITSLPLRYEYAFGGECRVNLDDPDVQRVETPFRLTPEQRSQHPDGNDTAPIAHTACQDNPLGMGFVEEWYLKAKKLKTFPAPQIDSPGNPVTEFCKTYPPQGFGVVTKAWQPRLKLAGSYDGEWLETRWPDLPRDFDMAFWNGAHPDMQSPHLAGNEEITLTNLTPEGTLKFRLPGNPPLVKVRYATGREASVAAKLDTLIIEPESMMVSLVWRDVMPTIPEIVALETGCAECDLGVGGA
ncbi:MAG: DUF2169 domain-containing protein [Deltaproteobacteria bacterium]|nr:DUF2169 domain-containing protein [Deltaproteobacteria bacterium]